MNYYFPNAWDYGFFGALFILIYVAGIMLGLEIGRKSAFRSIAKNYRSSVDRAYQDGFDAGYNTGKVDVHTR
ncbi:MAG TPA: hypothetical protein VIT23_01120 [Terrimicrobiaceae bacterium]